MMTEAGSATNKYSSVWLYKLVESMNQMARRNTNAVLLTLNGVQSIKPYQRYPQEPFYFADNCWRAFYHCHASPVAYEHEHGHYHFFTRDNPGAEWSHVVALSINEYGQPLGLFTTNLWVTDGAWFESRQLSQQLQYLEQGDDEILPLNWFRYVLLLYQGIIVQLLNERDQKLQELYPHNHEQAFIDRSIYALSTQGIDLLTDLSMLAEQESSAGH